MNKKNLLKKFIDGKRANNANKRLKYGLRKLSIGVVSCFLGYALALTPNISQANSEFNSKLSSIQSENLTNDKSKTKEKEKSTELLQGKIIPPVGQVDHSDLATDKVNDNSRIQKDSSVNPIGEIQNQVQKLNTQYTATYGIPGLVYVGNSTTMNISFKQNDKKVTMPEGTTFELGTGAPKGLSINKNTGMISYTPDSTEFENIGKEKNISVSVTVKYKDQSTSVVTANITVRNNQNVSKAPMINQVKEGQTKISGTGVKGSKIEVEIEKKQDDGETAGETTVKEDGTWEVTVDQNSLKKGYKVKAIQTEPGKTSTTTFTFVTETANKNPETEKQTPQEKNEITINESNVGDKVISGKGKPGNRVELSVTSTKTGRKFQAGTSVDNNGVWKVSLTQEDELEKGDIINVTQYEGNKENSTAMSIVKGTNNLDTDNTNPGDKKKPETENNKPENHEKDTQKDISETPTVNPVTEGDKTITGTGKAGAKIHVTSPQGLIIGENIEVDKNGKWILNVPKGIELKKGDVVLVVQQEEGKEISKQINTIVEAKKNEKNPQQNPDQNKKPQQDPPSQEDEDAREKEEQAKLTVEDVYEGDRTIKGSAAPGHKVGLIIELKNKPGTSISKDAVVDEKGNWSATLGEELKAGDKIIVTQYKKYANGEKTVIVKSKNQNNPQTPAEDNKDNKPNPPAKEDESRKEKSQKPAINPVKEGDTVISGKGIPGAKVSISKTDKNYSKGVILAKDVVVDEKGNWSVNIGDAKNFKAGDIIFAVQLQDGKDYSDQTEITVEKTDNQSKQPETKPTPDNKTPETKPEDKKPEAKTPEDKKPEDKKPEGETKPTPDNKTPETKPEDKKPEDNKKPEDKKPEDKKPEDKKPEDKKPEGKKPEDKKPEDKKPKDKKPNEKQKALSSFPLVHDIKSGDTKVNGKGMPGATIYVTKLPKNGERDGVSLSTVVGKDGNWSVDLKEAAKEGDEYIIQQQEKDKKDSPRILKVVQKADKKPEDKKPEDKKPEDKKPETDKKPEDNKKPEDKKPEGKKPEGEKKPEDNKKPEDKKPEYKKPEAKTPEDKKPEDKKPEAKKPEAKTPEVKKPEAKTPEVKKPEAKKPENKTPGAKKTKDKANNPQRRNKTNNKNNPKRKLPKAGYENEMLSLAIAGITTLGGVYLSKKKKNK
ncbi:Ig-like domain-containing protein [Finegoldia magna]|uniref:Ig-like domain-containing protein n=1 Tax=Finegoldia magna TaxID=1260 RepID=UPI0028FEB268|nr:Ig-like domain-containing protein [Finegoldia magna]MDU2500498.1 Ig-like domain-containing protein [Finegoldia magna]